MKRDDDRKFPCNVCGMSFRRNDIKRRHEITHSKEYRYFCAICGKGFIRRYVLVKHLARDHDTTDSRKIVYQKNKKKLEEEQNEHGEIMPSDLSQISHDSIEMKDPEGEEEPFTLMVADGVDMTTESAQQQAESKLSAIPQQDIPSSEVEQIKVIINEQSVNDRDLSEEQHIVTEAQDESEDSSAANIHVAALLTSDIDKSSALKQLVKVKDECTQIT